MKEYTCYLFDLDGTLTDPKVGITKSVQYALKKRGIVEDNLSELEKFIGPPLHESFKEFYNQSASAALESVDYYREYFSETGIRENEIYPYIEDLLKLLKENDKKIFVATSKPTVFAREIVTYFNIDSYFDQVVGSNLDMTRIDKTEIIEYILSNYIDTSQYKKESLVMIGDRKHDIIGAQNNNIDSIGVLYGYSAEDEIEDISPTYIVKDSKDLLKQIKQSLNLKK